MLKIFIGWSGERSYAIAKALRTYLPKILKSAKVWMSDDIPTSEAWFDYLRQQLAEQDVGIFCITPENSTAPWLMFEAGAFINAYGEKKAIPLLFGLERRNIRGPFQHIQAIELLARMDFYKLVKALNDLSGEPRQTDGALWKSFNEVWSKFKAKVKRASKIEIDIDDSYEEIIKLISQNQNLPDPYISSLIHLKGGFESHDLYIPITKIAKRRLYIFGRKNRKLFDEKQYIDFFKKLPKRINEGFDFRLLFLDPCSSYSHLAHIDKYFNHMLRDSIESCLKIFNKIDKKLLKYVKLYDAQRTISMIVMDNAILYSPIKFNKAGKAKRLTKAPFSIVNANSKHGKEILSLFLTTWKNAEPLSTWGNRKENTSANAKRS